MNLTLAFSKTPPLDLKTDFSDYACVAVILRSVRRSLELAFIRRAHNPQDSWSGQIAFPGGRRDPVDSHDLSTAIRETAEEVGWHLSEDRHLGFLTDVRARNRTGPLSFFLRPLVFYVEQEFPQTTLDKHEVDAVFWVPVKNLTDDINRTTLHLPERNLTLPGIKLPTGDTLWGLTYIVTQELLSKLDLSKIAD